MGFKSDPRFKQIHTQIKGARRIQDIWRVYYEAKWKPHVGSLPDAEGILRHTFYTGCAAMLELMQRVAGDSVTEDQGVEILQRLQDELDAYSKSETM